jgi:hypothetical protein
MARLTIYRSSDSGAPVLTGQVGALVALLDACLVNGYTASVTSITRSGGTATVTVPVPHNLIDGQLVTIAGAAETDYNGTFAITVVTGVVFTYTVPGAPATPATGVITYLRIAAGWSKPFTGTNKAAFKQGAGSFFYVRVQDDAPGAGAAREARVVGYETMTNVDTGTDLFPTAAQKTNGLFVRKSSTADATARNWILFADSTTFYLYVLSAGADTTPTAYRAFCFGDIYSLKTADNYKAFIAARNAENDTSATADTLDLLTTIVTAASNSNYIARGHNETAGAVNIGKHGDNAKANSVTLGIGLVAYTNPGNGAFYLSRVWVHDPTTTPVNGLRGRMRGLWQFLHPVGSVIDGDILIGTGELFGKTFLVVKASGNGGMYIMETSDTVESN